MSSGYPHKRFIMNTPQVHHKQLEAPAANARVYSQVIDRKDFRTALVFLKLPQGTAASEDNMPTRFEVYGVEDSANASTTRLVVLEKDLTGLSDWSGEMYLELDETHLAGMLGSESDGGPESLKYIQVAVSGVEDDLFEVIVVLQNPYTAKPELILEANVF